MEEICSIEERILERLGDLNKASSLNRDEPFVIPEAGAQEFVSKLLNK